MDAPESSQQGSLMMRRSGRQPDDGRYACHGGLRGFYSAPANRQAGPWWATRPSRPVLRRLTAPIRTGIPVDELLPAYEVVVIGAGAGGGVAACELAEAGRQVLLVERARPMRDSELRDNHIQGKRDQLYGVTAGPGPGNPRVWEHADGAVQLLRGDGNMGTYGLNAMTLGGGTVCGKEWPGGSTRKTSRWRRRPARRRTAPSLTGRSATTSSPRL